MRAVIVYGSDWEGLYLDGYLAEEGHRLDGESALRAVAFRKDTIEDVLVMDVRYNLEDYGNLPQDFKEFLELNGGY